MSGIVAFALILMLPATAEPVGDVGDRASGQAAPWNERILRAVDTMPKGGGYATNRAASSGLAKAVKVDQDGLTVDPRLAQPSFCSGATYLVFVKLLEVLKREKILRISDEELQMLVVNGQKDGMGVWGRWNANGPGVALLFHESGLGSNFESFDEAMPGDFMKIFWTDQVGVKEYGHLVVYMGRRTDTTGTVLVKFWSSNQPGGYGIKEVPLAKIHWAVFSRLLRPERVRKLPALGSVDSVSREMLKRSYSRDEVRLLTAMKEPRRPAVTIPRANVPPRAAPVKGDDSPTTAAQGRTEQNIGVLSRDSIEPPAPPETGTDWNIYVVRDGDTLSRLASRFGLSVERLRELNGLKDKDMIKIGTKLRVPASKR